MTEHRDDPSDVIERIDCAVAADRARIAARMNDLAANYPESVFPPNSDMRDAISGTAMRHAYRNAAREAAEGSSP